MTHVPGSCYKWKQSCLCLVLSGLHNCGVGIRRVLHYATELKPASINIQYHRTLNKINPGSCFISGGISESSSCSPTEEFHLRFVRRGRGQEGRRVFASDGRTNASFSDARGCPHTCTAVDWSAPSCVLIHLNFLFSSGLTGRPLTGITALQTGAFRTTTHKKKKIRPHLICVSRRLRSPWKRGSRRETWSERVSLEF